MLEILKFILGDFWVFLGFLFILSEIAIMVGIMLTLIFFCYLFVKFDRRIAKLEKKLKDVKDKSNTK